MNRKSIIFPALVLAISGGLLYSSMTRVKAADTTDWKSNFVQMLADKLGVSTDKVDTAVTAIRADRRQQNEDRFNTRLDELVQLGKITESQKTAIMNKHEELQKEWDAQEVQRNTHRVELQSWAKDNGIDLSLIGNMGVGRPGMGMGRGR